MDSDQLRSDIRAAYTTDQLAQDTILALASPDPPADWSQSPDAFLLFKNRIYVPNLNDLHLRVLRDKHDHILAGHPGQNKTFAIVSREYYWPELRASVRIYVQSCVTCGRNKPRRHKPYGRLQPLPIPERPWDSISMDFIEQLPNSNGFTAILVIVDRLSKLGIFIPTTDDIDSEGLARLFLLHVFSKHGAPGHISSDRGSEFISRFTRSLGTLLDMKLHHTSGHHPEANGQVERVNQTLEQYLRLYCDYQQTNWSDLLPIAEFTYNNTPSDSTGISPFYATKGYNPSIAVYPERDIASARARDFAVDIHDLQASLKEQIVVARDRYTASANARREPPPDFHIGDTAYVKSEHIRTTRPTRKLAERYLGPFKIIAQPGPQSFTIQLPDYLSTVHPVFHVSQLEPHIPDEFPGRVQEPPPPVIVDNEEEYEISDVLDCKVDRRYKSSPLRYYVRWHGYEGTAEEFSWVSATDLEHSPDLVRDFHTLHPTVPGSYEQYRQIVDAHTRPL